MSLDDTPSPRSVSGTLNDRARPALCCQHEIAVTRGALVRPLWELQEHNVARAMGEAPFFAESHDRA